MKKLSIWWGRHFLSAELMVCVLLGGSFTYWVTRGRGAIVVNEALDGNRSLIYSTTASVFGAMLGFVIATTTIALGYAASERFDVLRKSPHQKTLWRVFMSTIWVLTLATIAPFLGIVMDHDKAPNNWVMSGIFFFMMLAIARLARCVWILGHIINIVTTRPSDGGTAV